MAENTISAAAQKQIDYVAAYDERTRLFNDMRRLDRTDEQRAELLKQYKAAAKTFDKLRADLIS
jgi:hypothetical protein